VKKEVDEKRRREELWVGRSKAGAVRITLAQKIGNFGDARVQQGF